MYECPFRADDYDHCTLAFVNDQVVHRITFKKPVAYSHQRIQGVSYEFDKENDVVQVAESIRGPLLTNLKGLDISTDSQTLISITGQVLNFLLRLKELGLVYKQHTLQDFGRRLCSSLGVVVYTSDGLLVEFLEKNHLVQRTKRTDYLAQFKKFLIAFLFVRVSAKHKDQVIVCGTHCKCRKLRPKFSNFAYDEVHRIVCGGQTSSYHFPQLEDMVAATGT